MVEQKPILYESSAFVWPSALLRLIPVPSPLSPAALSISTELQFYFTYCLVCSSCLPFCDDLIPHFPLSFPQVLTFSSHHLMSLLLPLTCSSISISLRLSLSLHLSLAADCRTTVACRGRSRSRSRSRSRGLQE